MNHPIRRVSRSKVQAQSSYDRLSRWYDILASSERKYGLLGVQKLKLRAGEKALEIGFGAGRGLLALGQAVGPQGLVCGIDLSPGMLNVARRRLEAAQSAQQSLPQFDLRLGDATHLPFERAAFDAILISFTLELFDTPEIPQVLSECRRVLRPGGRAAVVSLRQEDHWPVRLYEWFHEKLPALVDCRPILAQAELKQAGFTVQEFAPHSLWGLPIEIIVAI